ncbi:hypothetical protein Ndes2526A_g03222 [Nannochloris sp. 'desiccata']
MEMIDLGTKDDEKPSQTASPDAVEPRPKKAKIDIDIRTFIIRQHSEGQTTNALPGGSNQASTVDELLASGAGTARKRDHAKEDEGRKFNPDWVDDFPWLRMTLLRHTAKSLLYGGKTEKYVIQRRIRIIEKWPGAADRLKNSREKWPKNRWKRRKWPCFLARPNP